MCTQAEQILLVIIGFSVVLSFFLIALRVVIKGK